MNECYCEQTESNGEQICTPCLRAQAAWEREQAAKQLSEGERETNRLLHYITGGDFL